MGSSVEPPAAPEPFVFQRLDQPVKIAEFESANTSGRAAIQASMLINGGAAVAVLSFVGQLVAKGTIAVEVERFGYPLACFVGGVFLGAVGAALTYLTQWSATWRRKRRLVSVGFNLLTIAVVAASLCLFALGCWRGYGALIKVKVRPTNHGGGDSGLVHLI